MPRIETNAARYSPFAGFEFGKNITAEIKWSIIKKR